MIGALLSMKFLGKKPWIQALGFWIIILIINMALAIGASKIGIMITLLSILVFILVAHYGFKLTWILSIVVWFVAFIIDIIIVYILFLVYPDILSFWYMPFGG
jgi:hypothetical protein